MRSATIITKSICRHSSPQAHKLEPALVSSLELWQAQTIATNLSCALTLDSGGPAADRFESVVFVFVQLARPELSRLPELGLINLASHYRCCCCCLKVALVPLPMFAAPWVSAGQRLYIWQAQCSCCRRRDRFVSAFGASTRLISKCL